MAKRGAVYVAAILLFGVLCQVAIAGRDKPYKKTMEHYSIPDVTLINQDGARVKLREILACDKPLLVDFVFTTCTTICPVLSANFANFQQTIISESGTARLVSISVDPEFDTPKEIKAYLQRYHAEPGWDFLTGSKDDIVRVLKAFDVYTANKMEHPPVFLLKSPRDKRWVRLYGMIGTSELLAEYEGIRD